MKPRYTVDLLLADERLGAKIVSLSLSLPLEGISPQIMFLVFYYYYYYFAVYLSIYPLYLFICPSVIYCTYLSESLCPLFFPSIYAAIPRNISDGWVLV